MYVSGHVLTEFFMPVDLVPLTSVYDILLSLCEMKKLRHFSPWIFHFFH